jgi:mono/diheme cytochrome c family protein
VDYPVWDISMGGGMLIAVVAVAHVVVSHFAIGGGLVIALTETLSVRRGDRDLRDLARRGSLQLILFSTVFGAISGVGIWVVVGLISPGAISALIHTYVWGWAIEWTFFLVEIVAALVYWATWNRVRKGAHLAVGWIYFVAAYLSLVVINGIITFQLTPGRWLETRAFWDGFFNPTYWPALVLRTGICAIMAAMFLLFLVRKSEPGARLGLTRYLAGWLVAGGAVAYAGYRWWEGALPETVLGVFRGDAPTSEVLAATRSVTLWALAATIALGVLLRLAPRAGTAAVALVAVAGVTFFGGYERVREGVRKPFLIHSHLFSNGLRLDDIEGINRSGLAAFSGWVTLGAGDVASPEAHGRQVFRAQCAICHTMDGYQAIRPRLPSADEMLAVAADDPPGSGESVFRAQCFRCHQDYTYEEMKDTVPAPDEIRDDPESAEELVTMMIESVVDELHGMGAYYAGSDAGTMIDTHETPHPQMPPMVGDATDREALTAYLASLVAPGEGAQ